MHICLMSSCEEIDMKCGNNTHHRRNGVKQKKIHFILYSLTRKIELPQVFCDRSFFAKCIEIISYQKIFCSMLRLGLEY